MISTISYRGDANQQVLLPRSQNINTLFYMPNPSRKQSMPKRPAAPPKVVASLPEAQPVQQWPNAPYAFYPREGVTNFYSPMIVPDIGGLTVESNLTPTSTPPMPEESYSQRIPRSVDSPGRESQDLSHHVSYQSQFNESVQFSPLTDDEEMAAGSSSVSERPDSASGQRRRVQNRVAQRAFRERKQQHVRDLEHELAELKSKYDKLEADHTELVTSYDRLKKVVEFITHEEFSDKVQAVREILEVLDEGQRLAKED